MVIVRQKSWFGGSPRVSIESKTFVRTATCRRVRNRAALTATTNPQKYNLDSKYLVNANAKTIPRYIRSMWKNWKKKCLEPPFHSLSIGEMVLQIRIEYGLN